MTQLYDYPHTCTIARPGAGDGYTAATPIWTHEGISCSADIGTRTITLAPGRYQDALGEMTFPPDTDVQHHDQITFESVTYRVIKHEQLRDPYGEVIEQYVYLGGV